MTYKQVDQYITQFFRARMIQPKRLEFPDHILWLFNNQFEGGDKVLGILKNDNIFEFVKSEDLRIVFEKLLVFKPKKNGKRLVIKT